MAARDTRTRCHLHGTTQTPWSAPGEVDGGGANRGRGHSSTPYSLYQGAEY